MKNALLESMKQMKLDGMATAYEAVLTLPVNQQPGAHEMMARLIDAEQQHRAYKRMNMYLRLSKLRYQATLQDIHCSTKRNLTTDQLAQADGTIIKWLNRLQKAKLIIFDDFGL